MSTMGLSQGHTIGSMATVRTDGRPGRPGDRQEHTALIPARVNRFFAKDVGYTELPAVAGTITLEYYWRLRCAEMLFRFLSGGAVI